MEARSIPELEDAARRYAAIRDKRMALNDAEVKLQDLLMGLLKKHGKREYKHDGIEVWIKVEEEKVKIRVTDEDEPPSSRKEKTSDKKGSSDAASVTGGIQSAQGSKGVPTEPSAPPKDF